MTKLLPLNAAKIGLLWPIEQGGIGVTAHTDEAGCPIIGLYPLNPQGHPAGQAMEFSYDRLMIRIVIGYDERCRATVIFADIELTPRGLGLRVYVPAHMLTRGYDDDYLFVAWGSPPLHQRDAPANSNWHVAPLPRKKDD